jgi:hypothetical protein
MIDRQALIARVEAGESFKYVFFWGHTPPAEGVDASCFSQWFEVGFDVDDVRYNTAEHYMMAGKAQLFNDAEMLEAILACEHPGEAKKLGRRVRGFDQEIWERERSAIVVAGNVAKFDQNPELGAYLLTTGERVLVEVSPRDRIWGIGMGRNNPDATDPRKWRGRNLLGFALMEVRDRLR